MEYTVKSGSPEKQRVACVVAGVFEHRRLVGAAAELDRCSGGYIARLIRRGDMDGKLGQTLLLHGVPGTLCDRVLLVGCGKERDFEDRRYRQASSAAARVLQECGARDGASYLPELHVKGRDVAWKVRQAVETIEHSLYIFDELKSDKTDQPRRPLRRLTLGVPSRRDLNEAEAAVRQGMGIAKGVKLARDLANRPGNICTPSHLAEQASTLAKQHSRLKIEVLEAADMEALGMGALLAVARGSSEAPKMIILEYRGGDKDAKPYVLVGKGITFDAGGISLKPAAAMDEMKFDMCGAATVIGATAAAAELELPINLVTLVPASENLPDGKAVKPGDIVTSLSGQTVEILNTDAEGRLILCDALTYAERYQPAAVIDAATLTGACVIALGNHASGLMGNDAGLIRELLAAGESSGDRAWELPLWDDYQKQLDSNFADFANVGGREAGTITAACFLSRFTKKMRWAHLDIAGTAWESGKNKGATGRPVPLLMDYLIGLAQKAS